MKVRARHSWYLKLWNCKLGLWWPSDPNPKAHFREGNK